MELLENILPIVNLVGVLVVASAVFYMRAKTGVADVSNDIINTYKMRVDQLIANEANANLRMHEHTQQISKMQGILQEKEKEVERLRSILENRNPELTKVLSEISAFMKKINEHMGLQAEIMSIK